MAHLFILEVYVSPNRKSVNLSQIYYFLDFSFSCPKMTLITIFTRMAQHLHYTFLPGRVSSRMFLAQCQSSEACESGSSSNHRLFVNRRPLGGKTNLSFRNRDLHTCTGLFHWSITSAGHVFYRLLVDQLFKESFETE